MTLASVVAFIVSSTLRRTGQSLHVFPARAGSSLVCHCWCSEQSRVESSQEPAKRNLICSERGV